MKRCDGCDHDESRLDDDGYCPACADHRQELDGADEVVAALEARAEKAEAELAQARRLLQLMRGQAAEACSHTTGCASLPDDGEWSAIDESLCDCEPGAYRRQVDAFLILSGFPIARAGGQQWRLLEGEPDTTKAPWDGQRYVLCLRDLLDDLAPCCAGIYDDGAFGGTFKVGGDYLRPADIAYYLPLPIPPLPEVPRG